MIVISATSKDFGIMLLLASRGIAGNRSEARRVLAESRVHPQADEAE